jgi:hypothetical protein
MSATCHILPVTDVQNLKMSVSFLIFDGYTKVKSQIFPMAPLCRLLPLPVSGGNDRYGEIGVKLRLRTGRSARPVFRMNRSMA